MDGSRTKACRRAMFQALIPARRLVRTMHLVATVGTTHAMLLRQALDLRRLLLRRPLDLGLLLLRRALRRPLDLGLLLRRALWRPLRLCLWRPLYLGLLLRRSLWRPLLLLPLPLSFLLRRERRRLTY